MELQSCTIIPAPASAAWQILGERFGDIAEWSDLDVSFLEGELGVGAMRVCQGPAWGPFPASRIKEELVEFDRQRMVFTYVGREGMPWFMPAAQNHWSVETLGPQRCRVCTRASVRLIWWLRPFAFLLRLAVRKPMQQLAEQLTEAILAQARAQSC